MTTTPYTVLVTERKVANPLTTRKSLAFFNTHPTATAFIRDGKGVGVGNGIPVYPQGNVSLNFIEDGDSVKHDWWAVGDATLTLIVFEGVSL